MPWPLWAGPRKRLGHRPAPRKGQVTPGEPPRLGRSRPCPPSALGSGPRTVRRNAGWFSHRPTGVPTASAV